MDWPRWVFLGLEWQWLLLGTACLLAAGVLAAAPERVPRAETWIDRRGNAAAAVAFGLWLPAWIILFKLAQFKSYQLMWDSGVTANAAWNSAHGLWFHSSVIGDRSYLSIHFAFLLDLLSPVLLLWPSAAALALLQGAAVGSSAAAVYLLARRRLRHASAAWLLCLLTLSQPFFHDIAGAVIDHSVFALPLFLWAVYAWECDRPVLSAAAWLALLTTREQVPFVFAGGGVYLLARARSRRGRLLAAGLILGSACLWLAEVRLIAHFQRGLDLYNYWPMFGALGGSRSALLSGLLREPWRAALALAWPPLKLWTVVRTLLCMALLPLGAGAAAWPAAIAWLPHQLADVDSPYHVMNAHASAFVFGPLIWASIAGWARFQDASGTKRRHLLPAAVLAVSGFLFLRTAKFLLPDGLLPAAWAQAAPHAFAAIGPDSKVWCDGFLLPQLAMRRSVKAIPFVLPDPIFETGLFLPDRVLFSVYWTRKADPAARDRILGFLARKGFRPAFQEADLVVLAAPEGAATGEPVRLP